MEIKRPKADPLSTAVDDYLNQALTSGEFADDEDITPEELAESEAAYRDYLSGRDPGISLEELKAELFGKPLE